MKIQDIETIKRKLRDESLTEHEFENVELKRDWRNTHGEKISMLCNGNPEHNCFLLIGVEDDGSLSGHNQKWLSKNLEIISQHLNKYLDPSISLIEITTEDINGSKVVICQVKNPGIIVKWDRTAYRGKGTTKVRMSQEEIMELNLSLPGLTDISKKKASFTPNEALVKDFCNMAGIEYDKYILDRYSLRNTKAGEILFGESKFRFVEYNDNNDILRNESRSGLLSLLTQETQSEIKSFYAKQNIDPKRITSSLLREAIGNCIGHAAYIENDGEIIVELHPTRIILSNLAYSEYSSLANKWFSSAHKSPNSFLMESLRVAKKVDELGRGKKTLLSECLLNGFMPPAITISEAGRFKRWSLQIDIKDNGDRFRKLRETLTEQYQETKEMPLIAYALVLWRRKPFSEILRCFDKYESEIVATIVTDIKGPVFLFEEEDRVVPHRWVKVLIEEGKASKEFTLNEEQNLFKHCQEIHINFHSGIITTAQFREIAHLSTSNSDKSLSSRLLGKWVKEGRLTRIKRGTYKFTPRKYHTGEPSKAMFAKILNLFSEVTHIEPEAEID
ncbi:RNA-binding domain-containing protein [Microbulbifer sp. TRSA005]|uniref:RNA-binding domain-containing protein n=1 Tax=Microbulbifer sp. TRSA005 TaxID=3243383 RepID=UPI0040390036